MDTAQKACAFLEHVCTVCSAHLARGCAALCTRVLGESGPQHLAVRHHRMTLCDGMTVCVRRSQMLMVACSHEATGATIVTPLPRSGSLTPTWLSMQPIPSRAAPPYGPVRAIIIWIITASLPAIHIELDWHGGRILKACLLETSMDVRAALCKQS